MNQTRSFLTLMAGWLCLIFAILILSLSIFLFLVQSPLQLCIVLAATSLFPVLIAVAALWPSQRTTALRSIGLVVCVACTGTLIMSFIAPPNKDQGRSGRGLLAVMAIVGGVMAVKGKWPGGPSHQETKLEIEKQTKASPLP